MTFVSSIKSGFKNFANYSGRASRSDYWYFYLFTLLVNLPFKLFEQVDHELFLILLVVASIIIIVPFISLQVRRYHDVGLSGKWFLLLLVIGLGVWVAWFRTAEMFGFYPIVGVISISCFLVNLVISCKIPNPGDNNYGPNPLLVETETAIDKRDLELFYQTEKKPPKETQTHYEKANDALRFRKDIAEVREKFIRLDEAALTRFMEILDNDPSIDPQKIHDNVMEEYKKNFSPFADEEINETYRDLTLWDRDVAGEFHRIVGLIGEQNADIKYILYNIIYKDYPEPKRLSDAKIIRFYDAHGESSLSSLLTLKNLKELTNEIRKLPITGTQVFDKKDYQCIIYSLGDKYFAGSINILDGVIDHGLIAQSSTYYIFDDLRALEAHFDVTVKATA